MSDPETITEADLAEALDGFWLHVACGGQRVHGQVADPDEVASVLLATLGRIAAERSPDEPALPVGAALDRPTIDAPGSGTDDTGRDLAGDPERSREQPAASWRERAEAAERKLAAIAALEPWETCASTGADLVRVSDIQAITGSEGGDSR